MKTSSKEYYSRANVAEKYDDERFVSLSGKMFSSFEEWIVSSNLPEKRNGMKLLDVGTGSGRFAIEMAKQGFNVVACDYSQAMLDTVNRKIEELGLENHITLSRQDATELSFDDNTFDFVSCIRVSVNLDTIENVEAALKELIRVCKPGGRIVFDIVNPKSLAFFRVNSSNTTSIITLKKAKGLIASIPTVNVEKYCGKRIVSPLFEKAPAFILKPLDKLDAVLSKYFLSFCIRIYFVLTKQEDKFDGNNKWTE